MQPTIEQLIKMMDFLKVDSFVIPSYSMKLPDEADGENWRPERIFRLHRNGKMSYRGWGYVPRGMKKDVEVLGITLNNRWIDRAYLFLAEEVRNNVKRKAEKAVMEKVGMLILKFNGLDFIDLNYPA
jgi:hypothetical protein